MTLPGRTSRNSEQGLRDRLIEVLKASNLGLDGDLGDDTSLIKSGKIDSLGLFNLAVFIEKEVGCRVDVGAYELADEWNTIPDILHFIAKLTASS